MEKERIPKKNPDIVDRTEQQEALLFDPASGGMMCLNSTGIFIWGNCDGAKTRKDIIEALEKEYEVSYDEAEKDCETFLLKLENAGFIGYME